MYSNTKMEQIGTDKDLTRVWLLFEYTGVLRPCPGDALLVKRWVQIVLQLQMMTDHSPSLSEEILSL